MEPDTMDQHDPRGPGRGTEGTDPRPGPTRRFTLADLQILVATACGGDDGLRRHIEELLAAPAQASDVLGPAATSAAVIVTEAPTMADEAVEEDLPSRGAGPEATDPRTPPNDPSLTIDHGPEPDPGDPRTMAPLDDR